MARYYVEESDPCGQDRIGEHWIEPMLGKDGLCPGGSRRELEDVEIVEAVSQWDGVGFQCNLPVSGSGRYAIIPLSGNTE